jgi:PAS domain S-box-containing protein
VDPNFPPQAWPKHWAEVKRRGSFTFESQHRTKGGELVAVEITVNYLEFEGREYNGAFVREITGRKRMEERLARLHALKERLLGPIALGEKLTLITEGVVELFGADFARIWLLDQGDLCEKGCRHAAITQGPEACRDRRRCLHLVASSGRYTAIDGSHRRVPVGCYKIGRIASGDEPTFVTNDVTHDPRVHQHQWAASLGLVSFAGYRLLSPEGAVLGVLALFSGRKIEADEDAMLEDLANTAAQVIATGRAEELLRREKAFADIVIDSIPGVFYVLDDQGRFVRWNHLLEELTGLNAETLCGTDAQAIIFADDRQRVAEKLREVFEKGLAEIEARTIAKDGLREFWFTGRRMDVGPTSYLVGSGIDITDRKRMEEEIRRARDGLEIRVQERTAELAQANVQLSRAKDDAEAASRAKSAFLANMSHEIRTPLNAVIGMTELALKSRLSPQQRELLQTVSDSGEALLSLINDILDFSKIEAGKLALECSNFDLWESLGDTMKSFAIRAHQKGLELACFIHPDVPHVVVGDYGRLRQIVVNIVGNAIKFTERGEVSLEVTRESHAEKDLVLHFTVADTGIGIPPEKQSVIFGMFEQADTSTTRRHGGTGLGLAIAARLVGLMGGRIWVESEAGRGSRFHFVVGLGLADVEAAEASPPEPASLHGIRVLVVDDNATNRHILEEVLRSWQMVPATAPSAAEAVELLLEAKQTGEPYRLALTDAHMPYMDGFMLAEQIKQDPAIGSTVVMMLTSGDSPEDVQRCETLGIAAYLLKPIKQLELLEAIELALGITVSKTELLAPAAHPRKVERLHILLAEDSLVNQKLAVALLEGQGHEVRVVNNGREAIAALQTDKVDMVLMDIQMPEMDGLEATKRIRVGEQHTGGHIPIIAMTAHALKGDRERCLAAGMDGYIAKPIHVNELFKVIEGLFAASAAVVGQPALETPQGEIVNWQEALQALEGNPQLLRTVVDAELVEIPRRMEAIRQAVTKGNANDLRLAAHALKGSLRYLGKTTAFEEVLRLERMGQHGNLAEARGSLDTLELEILRINQALHEYLERHPATSGS